MKTIYKYRISSQIPVEFPTKYKVLHVGLQKGEPHVWCLVDSKTPVELCTFAMYGTGWDMPNDPGEYVGTYFEGPYVWHMFKENNISQCSKAKRVGLQIRLNGVRYPGGMPK